MPIVDLIKIPTVQAFLMNGSVISVFEAILEKFALPKERAIELLDLTDAVLDGAVDLKEIAPMLQQAFGVEEERAVRMACDVVGFRLLPLEEFVPNVVAQLTTWGADMSKYPKSRVGKVKMTPETLAAQIEDKLELDFSEVLVKRCGFLIGAYWRGEKTKESTLTFFSRATTIGGLGLSPEQSLNVLNAVDEQRDMIELTDGGSDHVGEPILNSGEEVLKEIEEDSSDFLGREKVQEDSDIKTLEISPSHEVAAEVPVISAPEKVADRDGNWHAELREATKKAQQVARVSMDGGGVAHQEDSVADRAVENARTILQKLSISEQAFREIVLKTIKGVRNLYQTRDVLARDLNVQGEDLEKIIAAVEEAQKLIVSRDENESISGREEDNVQIPDATLDKRFAALVKDAPRTHEEGVLPGSRVSLARTAEEEQTQQIKAVSEEKLVEAAIASRPTPVKPMLTVGSVAPAQHDRVLTDIQPVKRLIGPVDELRAMTPTEFRRLSSVPADAVQKIEDILSTLEAQSYEDRVKGIAAWHKSPMNQLYASMTTAALMRSVAVAEIAAKRRAAGEESLSPAEIRAVSSLNEKLRF
ncbi:MAG: hypothetical protein WCT28_01300 [Patescibacteria group bacterium]|jgi:hypothetical protein